MLLVCYQKVKSKGEKIKRVEGEGAEDGESERGGGGFSYLFF